MAELANDRFRRYYAEKLWEMIPPIYRLEDGLADRPGVLRALVEVLADQAAIVRRSQDRLWDDQFIDLCDNWAVSYLGDLVATRMVSALDARGRRADVANTIYYRRRAGTLAVLEGLIADITGWEGTVVEEFRRLLRHPHGLDPAPARTGRFTQTPAFGLPDLRVPRGAQLASGAWDEFLHLPDMRRHKGGMDGRYGIAKLGFHLFRLLAFRVVRATPRLLAADVNGHQRFSFDPSGRSVPLFQRHSRPDFAFEWRAALEWEMPAPMRCEVLAHAQYQVSEALILGWRQSGVLSVAQADLLRTIVGLRFGSESQFRARLGVVFGGALSVNALHRLLADALVADCGKGVLLPAGGIGSSGDTSSVGVEIPDGGGLAPVPRELCVAGNLSTATPAPADKRLVIDAENGLGYFTNGVPPAGTAVTCCYGFAGSIGAGAYRRAGLPEVAPAHRIQGGGAINAPAAALDAALEIEDSATYGPVADVVVQKSLLIQASDEQRPYLELAGDWTLTARQNDSELTLDGLWIGGRAPRQVHLAAAANSGWSEVTIVHATLDPGGRDADGGALGPIVLSIDSRVDRLVIDASVLGRVVVSAAGLIENLVLRNSIVHSTGAGGFPVALSQPSGALDIRGCTVIGQMKVHRIEASELLCTDVITVDDLQSGCVRFSAFPAASQVPRAYRSQSLTDVRSLFTSTRFGDPGYAQLSDVAPDEILRGGDNGTEIGAFNVLLNPIKVDSLRAKLDEFLPFGLIPLLVTET